MKKNSILIILFFCIYSPINAFFWEPTSIDLYKNIDSWIDTLEDNMLSFELNGSSENTGIIKEINLFAISEWEKACLDESKELNRLEFEEILNSESVKKIADLLIVWCITEITWEKIYTTEILNRHLRYFKHYYNKSKNTAEKKSKQIYSISNIWLYSDWIIENSWFDLIVDIEEIDKILFFDETDYEWEWHVDFEESVKDSIKSSLDSIENELIELGESSSDKNNESVQYSPLDNNVDIDNEIKLENKYLCSEPLNNTWLNEDNLNFLLDNVEKNITKDDLVVNINEDTDNIFSWPSLHVPNDNINWPENWDYDRVRDNSEWPCEKFFCINIDFIMYEFNLLKNWEKVTIEYLLNRSNDHLKKFAASSLMPAKMATNLFEISLKDLNLPDIFHMAIQVDTLPVPILEIEDKWKTNKK